MGRRPREFEFSSTRDGGLHGFVGGSIFSAGSNRLLSTSGVVTLVSRRGVGGFGRLVKCCRVTSSRLSVPSERVVRGCRKLARVRSRFQRVGKALRAHPIFIQAGRRVRTRLVVYFVTLAVVHLVRHGAVRLPRVTRRGGSLG